MKLVFKKNEAGDVSVDMFVGTATVQFSYIEMIKALIAGEPLDADFDESVSEDEQKQIKEVLKEIEATAKEKENEADDEEPEVPADAVDEDEWKF